MQIDRTQNQHYFLDDNGTSLKITFPVQKNYFVIFGLSLWLLLWIFAEFIIFTKEIPKFTEQGPVMWMWLIVATVSGIYAAEELLLQINGKEIVQIDYESIEIKWDSFGFGRIRKYSVTKVDNLHISSPYTRIKKIKWQQEQIFRNDVGFIGFDSDWKTVYFGHDINEIEAKEIIEKIIARFPKYGVRK